MQKAIGFIQNNCMDKNFFKSWDNELAIINKIEGLLVPGQEKALLILASVLKPHSTVVEIGSFKGKSTACFALGSRPSTKIFSIDTFGGNGRDFKEGIQFTGSSFYRDFIHNIKAAKAITRVKPLVGFSSEIGLTWNKPIDLLYIDGSHIYEDVKRDVELFFPWVKQGGLVLLHDVDPAFPGVYKVWNKIVKNNLTAFSNDRTLYFGIKKGLEVKINRSRKIIKFVDLEISLPKIFVIIPVYNRLAYTVKCLDSLKDQTYKNFETILIDDGSTDGTFRYIRRNYPDVKIIKGTGKWWWTKSVYRGIHEASKTALFRDYILTMNNDCCFNSDYLENAVKASKNDRNIIVGSLTIDAQDHKVIDSGIKIDWKHSLIKGLKSNQSNYNLDTLPGRGTLIPVEVFGKIGNFNYLLFPHNIADYEFFCRAKRNGYKLQVSNGVKLYNFTEEIGENQNSETKQDFRQILNLLFGRKSKINVIDYTLFVILCCPPKYIFGNLFEAFRRSTKHILFLHKTRLLIEKLIG